jgi:cellulose biosynthesis protein BcsQ
MKFTRTKKLVFVNNKGGVGKTTLAFNCAVEFSKKGYKTVLVDLDPQCNLSRLALGDVFMENNLFDGEFKDVYDVLRGIVEGGSDIDLSVNFINTQNENLSILPGSLKLTNFENILIDAYGQATGGNPIGYFQTSAIDRFLRKKGLDENIDVFIIDTSPNLGLLNRIILLGSDYFVVPMAPDAFSLQGIENLGNILELWKQNWKNTGRALSQGIPSERVLSSEGLFIGYVINSYNQYNKQPIKQHRNWIEEIPNRVKKYLSEKHCRNGLVEKSWKNPLESIKDYGQLPAMAQDKNKAIFELSEDEIREIGTRENLEQSKKEFDSLSNNILKIIEQY